MHDFFNFNPADVNYKILAEQTGYFKEDKEGLESMCRVVEDMINEEVKNEMKEVALRLIKECTLTSEKIAECCQLTITEVIELEKEAAV